MFGFLLAAVIAFAPHAAPLHAAPTKAIVLTGNPIVGESWIQGDVRVTVAANVRAHNIATGNNSDQDLIDLHNLIDGSNAMMLATVGPWAGQGDGVGVDAATICLPGQTLQLCSPITSAVTFGNTVTLTAAGTALTVNNNATITGTLTAGTLSVSGNATVTGTLGVTGQTTINGNATTTPAVICAGTLPCDISVVPAASTDVVQIDANGGTCTASNALLKLTKSGASQDAFKCNGDVNIQGVLALASTASASGEIATAGANKISGAAGTGDIILGGGTTSSVTNGNCTGSGCGGHVHQSIYFSASVSSGSSVTCTAPIACRINSTSSSAITSITLTFLQAFTEPPTGCLAEDEGGHMTSQSVTFTGTPGTSITAAVFTLTGTSTGTQNYDVGCGIGNGP